MRIENSFIPVDGVGEHTERQLWQAGVTHWDHFTGDVVGPTRAERINSFIDRAKRRLQDRDSRFFRQTVPDSEHWRLYENFRSETVFLDIETTGLSRHTDRVTTVTLHRDGETTTLVRGRDLTAQRLARYLEEASLLVTFNGCRFDVPFLEASYDLTIDLPHADLMLLCRTLGHSGGLSDIERTFGIERERPDISGQDAVRLWHEYQAGDEGALETLIEYNRMDTVNMQPIMEEVTDRLHQQQFASVIPD